jgi:hypothetical protein
MKKQKKFLEHTVELLDISNQIFHSAISWNDDGEPEYLQLEGEESLAQHIIFTSMFCFI